MAEQLAIRRSADQESDDAADDPAIVAAWAEDQKRSTTPAPFGEESGAQVTAVETGAGGQYEPPSYVALLPHREVWAVDFELSRASVKTPSRCVWCLGTKQWTQDPALADEFGAAPPYPTGADVLFVAYYASAEIGCHLALGWPVPAARVGLVHRVPQSHQRHSHGQRRRLARCARPPRFGRHRHRRKRRKCAT